VGNGGGIIHFRTIVSHGRETDQAHTLGCLGDRNGELIGLALADQEDILIRDIRYPHQPRELEGNQ
jgi:hypothetical protein